VVRQVAGSGDGLNRKRNLIWLAILNHPQKLACKLDHYHSSDLITLFWLLFPPRHPPAFPARIIVPLRSFLPPLPRSSDHAKHCLLVTPFSPTFLQIPLPPAHFHHLASSLVSLTHHIQLTSSIPINNSINSSHQDHSQWHEPSKPLASPLVRSTSYFILAAIIASHTNCNSRWQGPS